MGGSRRRSRMSAPPSYLPGKLAASLALGLSSLALEFAGFDAACTAPCIQVRKTPS